MTKTAESFTFIDLFAGIGGMRIAFEKAGGKCIYTSEWNKFSAQTYEANFGDMPEGDITKISASQIPDHDVLVAGFPCQPFSIAGVSKKRSLNMPDGFDDEIQGTLFFDVVSNNQEKKTYCIPARKRKESQITRWWKYIQGNDEGTARTWI